MPIGDGEQALVKLKFPPIPDRLMVGQRPLEPLIVVRIHVGEPTF
jgi:hypothetical protein